MACILCPWAAKLPGNPGERGVRAVAGSEAKIRCIQTETRTGPKTTWPLTPLTCYLMTSTQGETEPSHADPSRPLIYSETGARAGLVSTHRIYTQTCSTSAHRRIPFLRTHTSPQPPNHPYIHSLRREKGYWVCGLLAHWTSSVFSLPRTHTASSETLTWNLIWDWY